MKPNRNIRARAILSALYFVTGASIFIYGEFATIDSFWSGMGTALMVVGALQTIRLVRYNTNPRYKEATDTAVNDERNKGAFVMGAESMDIERLLSRSQSLAQGKGKGGGK